MIPAMLSRLRRVCVFYYRDASVRKDSTIDVHASKLVSSVGLDVDVLIVRT